MIRKDILPDIWGDSWHSEATEQTLTVARGTERTVVLCNPADAPMFMLREGLGYNVMPDIENLRINVEQGGRFTLYRLQGMNTTAQHITQLNLTMQDDATVDLCTVTLGGGHVRNNITVRMQGEGCRLNADGLYLIDREQECDNYIFVEHAKPRCHSRELYKGIMDDAARARFNGHVLVQDGAVKTEAYQTNHNILLTDKAHVDTRPFLEIYNDGELMSKERIDKLFKPYEKGTGGKFGLGLSIVKKVVETYGYNVTGENMNDGVIFRVYRLRRSKRSAKKSDKV